MKEPWQKIFFESFYSILREEAESLRNICEHDCFRNAMFAGMKYEDIDYPNMFEKEGFRYARYNAIALMSEETLAYFGLSSFIFELEDYPLTAKWNYPYPHNTELKAAFGLVDRDGELDSLIEFKKWTSNDCKEIKQSIDKYKLCDSDCNKYLCVVQLPGGDIEENIEHLLRENPELEVLHKNSFESWLNNVNVLVHLYMLKIN